ncbi:MAG TPA: flavoprotein [Chloroflexota bacterium]|nr:flavoprotein [Chloroflexota bacterium]
MPYDTLYLIVSGAATARRVPRLLPRLCALVPRIVTVLTPNAQRVVSPRELALVAEHRIVESYFDTAILPRPAHGVTLVAPCSFNTLNKLAQGIADNLALSIVAEAIGRRTPVVVAVSTNPPLWAHPRAHESAETLRRWGCQVLDPVTQADTLTLASDEAILTAVSGVLA